jgi:SAM-dependent methyltransferase
MNRSRKFRYFLWALTQGQRSDRSCPSCTSLKVDSVRRKFLVTALLECQNCGLRFRVPKDTDTGSRHFYQGDYEQGFTTDLPSDEQLKEMLVCRFKNTVKDYQTYITVLHAIGVEPGATILDFGCSWGYGSWQLQDAGFRVYSYEVNKSRAEFARRKLGCSIVGDDLVSDPIDCLFSAHVLEHLTDPNLLWRIAERVLSPNGVVVCFLPNGDSRLEAEYGSRQYHQLWGQVHPLLVGPGAAAFMAERHAYIPVVHTSPYDLQLLRANTPSDHLVGQELLLIARKATHERSKWS